MSDDARFITWFFEFKPIFNQPERPRAIKAAGEADRICPMEVATQRSPNRPLKYDTHFRQIVFDPLARQSEVDAVWAFKANAPEQGGLLSSRTNNLLKALLLVDKNVSYPKARVYSTDSLRYTPNKKYRCSNG